MRKGTILGGIVLLGALATAAVVKAKGIPGIPGIGGNGAEEPENYISITKRDDNNVDIAYYNQSTGNISSTHNHYTVFEANMAGWLSTYAVINQVQYDNGIAQFHSLGF